MSERDICERLDNATTDWDGSRMQDGEPPRDLMLCRDLREAAATIRTLRETLRRADELLAEGVGIEDGADDWRGRVRAFLGERS